MGNGDFMMHDMATQLIKTSYLLLRKTKNIYFSNLNSEKMYKSRCHFLIVTGKLSVF